MEGRGYGGTWVRFRANPRDLRENINRNTTRKKFPADIADLR